MFFSESHGIGRVSVLMEDGQGYCLTNNVHLTEEEKSITNGVEYLKDLVLY
jgi:hypothetical protein